MKRRRFTSEIKESLVSKFNRECADCGMSLKNKTFHWDHIIPLALGGDDTQENLQPLCTPCHSHKTGKKDIPAIAKAKRLEARHLGIKKKSKMPFGKDSPFKKKINGTIERRI